MKFARSLSSVTLCVLVCACQAPTLVTTEQVRVSAHYTASGAVGLAKAYVYADRTVVEMESAADAAIATDAQGKPYSTDIEGRYIRFEGVHKQVQVHIGSRRIDFTLAPVAKVFSAGGIALAPLP